VAARLNVDMPICGEIYRILHEGVSPRAAVSALMGRALKPE
jgi:glycerol-3-phosphate dehydrogenase (NAD(P)+)